MFYDNTYKHWEITEQITGHYDLFIETVCLKKAMSKKNIISFQCSVYMQHVKRVQISWNIASFNN
jgi:hypothetical protein